MAEKVYVPMWVASFSQQTLMSQPKSMPKTQFRTRSGPGYQHPCEDSSPITNHQKSYSVIYDDPCALLSPSALQPPSINITNPKMKTVRVHSKANPQLHSANKRRCQMNLGSGKKRSSSTSGNPMRPSSTGNSNSMVSLSNGKALEVREAGGRDKSSDGRYGIPDDLLYPRDIGRNAPLGSRRRRVSTGSTAARPTTTPSFPRTALGDPSTRTMKTGDLCDNKTMRIE